MHDHLLESDEIDANLYPALLEVFIIIIIGYLAGSFQILTQQQGLGLNKFVGTFALPALLFRNLVVLDFSSVDWLFLSSIFISKTIVFVLAIVITLSTLRPINIGMAAIFAIFVSQSNDFALGNPIVKAVYSKSHPDYIHYIYLLAPISLVILNPIAFVLLEINEKLNKKAIKTELKNDTDEEDNEQLAYEETNVQVNEINNNIISRRNMPINNPLQNINEIQNEEDLIHDEAENDTSLEISKSDRIKTRKLIKSIVWSTVSNPIVFMVVIGIAANFILKQKVPALIDPIISTLADSFSAIALFYLGFSMFGRIKNLKFSSVVIILILIFTKGLLFPLITREIVLHLENTKSFPPNSTQDQIAFIKNETDSLSTFGFLYGTFPTAPALFFYISKYEAVQHDLISAAVVFGTLASAPLMMISGKMISIQYSNNTASNFEDIQCKTAYGFSILSWFCCLWVLYIFLASGRLLKKPHIYTFLLIVAQMATAVIHVIWSSVTNTASSNQAANLSYVFFTLLSAYVTRCLPVAMMLNIISLTDFNKYSNSKLNRFISKLAAKDVPLLLFGIGLPLIATILSLAIPGLPQKQGMMIALGKPQQIISTCLLLLVILVMGYLLIVFARSKSHQSRKRNFENGQYERIEEYMDDSANEENNQLTNGSLLNRSLLDGNVHNHLNGTSTENDILVNKELSAQVQLMPHISLIVILTFNCFLCLFVQLWCLFEESKSGIYYELELLDTTLLFGQGVFTFFSFGLDSDFIFAPVLFKIKEILGIIAPFKLKPVDQLPIETVQVCKKFEQIYKRKCMRDLEEDHRFHYKYYRRVFKGSDFVDWLKRNRLAKNRRKGVEFARQLLEGRVIQHVSLNRHFHDGFHLYRFIR